MSLRIIVKPDQVKNWITQRQGTIARKRGTDAEFHILFDAPPADCEPVAMDDFLTGLQLSHQVLLVDEAPGKTYHRFVDRA